MISYIYPRFLQSKQKTNIVVLILKLIFDIKRTFAQYCLSLRQLLECFYIIMTDQERVKKINHITLLGSFINFLLVVFKFIAGIAGQSSAMIADAVHSLSDFVTDIIVLLFVRISNKPIDEDHDYGHGKFETLATAIIGIILLGVGIGILWSGISKVISFCKGQMLPTPGMLAFWAAIISIVLKEFLYQYTIQKGKGLNSQTVIANAWHHRSDALSSIGTAIGIGGAILLGEQWHVLDPIAAIIVSFFIIKVAIKLIIPCMDELLEKSLPADTEKEILSIVLSKEGVTDPHNLRTRRIGNHIAIEVHIRMDGKISLLKAHEATKSIEAKLKDKFGENTHIAIHVEPIK